MRAKRVKVQVTIAMAQRRVVALDYQAVLSTASGSQVVRSFEFLDYRPFLGLDRFTACTKSWVTFSGHRMGRIRATSSNLCRRTPSTIWEAGAGRLGSGRIQSEVKLVPSTFTTP